MYSLAHLMLIILCNQIILCRGFALGTHCRRYPYAPRCLGVAAKRSPSRTDIYTSLINRALEDAVDEDYNRQTEVDRQLTELGNVNDRKSTLNKLASIILAPGRKAHRERSAFPDADDPWSVPFVEYENNQHV